LSLASAPESEVLAAWSGLGYYSRARNVRRAAIAIAGQGGFPRTLDQIRALPGIGPYTAAAVASIAFDLPHAVLDGNVMRVIARLKADPGDIGSGTTRTRFQEVAQGLLDPPQAAAFNQAMMELGATVCLPRNPLCLVCPVAKFCAAHATGRQTEFPVKLRKAAPIDEAVEIVVVSRAEEVLMRQRGNAESRMAGFWELPSSGNLPELSELTRIGEFRHTIVNHRYSATVFSACASAVGTAPDTMAWVRPDDPSLPVTTMARKALNLFAKRERVVQIRR
jgi:A/G-specific adenine glycosylase